MKRLNPAERQNNLKKAFNIGRNDVKLYDRIILVDDIYTTGTTLDEIAALLKSHGVSEVYCLRWPVGPDYDEEGVKYNEYKKLQNVRTYI